MKNPQCAVDGTTLSTVGKCLLRRVLKVGSLLISINNHVRSRG